MEEVIESKNYSPDNEFMKKFSLQFDEVKKYVSRPIGYFEEPLSARNLFSGIALSPILLIQSSSS